MEQSDEMKLRILGVFGLILLGCIGSKCVASLALQWKTIALAWDREEQSSCQAEEQPEPAHQRRWRRCKVKGTSSTRRFRGRPRVKRPYTQMHAGSVVETDEQAAEAEALEAGGAEAKDASHETEETSDQVLVAGKSGDHLPFYRPDIDGLRAVAVISVILFHLQPSLLPGGFAGVDIFFVISGYVVSGSLLREQHTSSGSYLVAFYARRIKRLFPALLATCLATSFLMGFIPEWTAALADYYTTGMLALIGWANQHFAFMPTGYFDDGPEGLQYNPFTHNWSLGVEEQFYLLYPCIVLYAFRSRVLIECNSKPCISPLLLLGVSFLLSFGISLWMSREWQLAAYYLLPSRFWQLMAGSLLFVIHDSRWGVDLSLGASLVLEGAAVFLLSFSIIFTPGDHGFPLPWSIPAICGALATIASGATRTQRVCGVQLPLLRTALSHPTMVFIGKLSYPLYLAHWPIVVACRWTEGVDNLLQRVAAAAFTVVAACILYFCVEAPFRRWRPKRKWHVFAVFGVLLLGMELWLWLCKGPLYGRVQRLVQSSMQGSADNALLIELYPPSPLSPLPALLPPPYLPPPPTSPTLSPPPAPPSKPPDPPSPPHLQSSPHPLLPSPSPPVLSPMPSSLPHSPSNPASPPPTSPSSCSAVSRTGKSVYDSLHPAYSSLDAMHALSQYSTFTKRGCRCKLSPSAALKHVPLEAVRKDATSAHLPQCFVPARPDQLPMLRGVQAFFDEQPCLLRLQQFSQMSDENRRTAAAERVLQCLSPVRTGTLPRRAIFAIGDSHMAQLARSLMTAFDGAASVVWAASAFMCGFVSEDFIDTLLKSHFSRSKPEALDTCRIFNQKVDEALETLLQPCDIVVLHQRSWSQGSDHDLDGKLVFENDGGDSPQGSRATMFERIRQLQQLVKSRGATLVLIGDVAHLPKKAPYCASSLSAATRCETSHAAVLGQVAVEQGLYTSLARQHGTYYMPLHELFCSSSGREIRCGALVPGTATLGYLDDNHLGTAGTAYLWPHICDFFNKHGLLGTS